MIGSRLRCAGPRAACPHRRHDNLLEHAKCKRLRDCAVRSTTGSCFFGSFSGGPGRSVPSPPARDFSSAASSNWRPPDPPASSSRSVPAPAARPARFSTPLRRTRDCWWWRSIRSFAHCCGGSRTRGSSCIAAAPTSFGTPWRVTACRRRTSSSRESRFPPSNAGRARGSSRRFRRCSFPGGCFVALAYRWSTQVARSLAPAAGIGACRDGAAEPSAGAAVPVAETRLIRGRRRSAAEAMTPVRACGYLHIAAKLSGVAYAMSSHAIRSFR